MPSETGTSQHHLSAAVTFLRSVFSAHLLLPFPNADLTHAAAQLLLSRFLPIISAVGRLLTLHVYNCLIVSAAKKLFCGHRVSWSSSL